MRSGFLPLRIVRDALTHTNIGSCFRDRETGAIRYFSNALKPICERTYIDDFMAFVATFRDRVNDFLGHVFHELIQNLEDIETWQMCGIFYGRGYHRLFVPAKRLTFNPVGAEHTSGLSMKRTQRAPL